MQKLPTCLLPFPDVVLVSDVLSEAVVCPADCFVCVDVHALGSVAQFDR